MIRNFSTLGFIKIILNQGYIFGLDNFVLEFESFLL